MYRVAIEGVLGLRRRGQTFSLDPTIPAMWPGFSMTWSVEGTRYDIIISNPQNRCGGIEWVTLDGEPVDARAIPVLEDRQPHRIEVMLGNTAGVAPRGETQFAS
jgi:cyclic beta-1,2-glucan synthetase